MSRSTARVLCDDCARDWATLQAISGERVSVYLAALGPVPADDDDAILVCVPWAQRRTVSTRRRCSDCGIEVAVAASSLWLLGESRPGPS